MLALELHVHERHVLVDRGVVGERDGKNLAPEMPEFRD